MKNILILFGGCSSEYSVSLCSASAVLHGLNPSEYQAVPVGITQTGDWYYYPGPVEKIQDDTWHFSPDCIPALLSPNRSRHCLLLMKSEGVEELHVDAAFPILHGKNGEDGTLQGIIELSGIPLIGCGTLSSAICMDKDRAHKLASLAGIRVPKAMVLDSCHDSSDLSLAQNFADDVGYPLYVKPVKAGSSYGVTRVSRRSELQSAMNLAFQYDNQIILEENIEGFEVGCAVLGKHQLIIGEVDEIELSGGFFDFTEKYTLKTSAIYVPARISAEKRAEIKSCAKRIYKALGCSGFARVDMFLTPEGEIVFNEVNTIPGFTEHSRYPGMMKAAGYSFCEVLTKILEVGLEDTDTLRHEPTNKEKKDIL